MNCTHARLLGALSRVHAWTRGTFWNSNTKRIFHRRTYLDRNTTSFIISPRDNNALHVFQACTRLNSFFQLQPRSIEYTRLRIEVRLKIFIEPAVSFETDYSDKGPIATNQLIQRIEQVGEMLVEKKVALRSVCSWTISREHSYICLNNPPTTPRFLRQNQRESRPRNIVAALRSFRHWKGILKKVISLVAQRNDRPTSSLKLSSIITPNSKSELQYNVSLPLCGL